MIMINENLEETCPRLRFSTTNPTQADLGSNPALRAEDLTTDF
jgi:hypothetical protein